MREGFSVIYGGETVKFCPPCALAQLRQPVLTAALMPVLAGFGMAQQEALALAYNCALLSLVLTGEHQAEEPQTVLNRYSLADIAGLARAYFEHGDLPFEGAWEESSTVADGVADALSLL